MRKYHDGIRHGIVPSNKLEEWVFEELEPIYDCAECIHHGDSCDFCDPSEHYLKYDDYGIEAVCVDNVNLIVLKSDYVAHCNLASPCFPNGCVLNEEGNFLAYALPKDWFVEDLRGNIQVEKRK